ALSLLMAGACDAITDVAQNAHGLRVQREYRRSIINSFHAVWSIGAVLGGSRSALAIALDVPLPVHLGLWRLTLSVVAVLGLRFAPTARAAASLEPRPAVPAPRGTGSPTCCRSLCLLPARARVASGASRFAHASTSRASASVRPYRGSPAALAARGYIGRL